MILERLEILTHKRNYCSFTIYLPFPILPMKVVELLILLFIQAIIKTICSFLDFCLGVPGIGTVERYTSKKRSNLSNTEEYK